VRKFYVLVFVEIQWLASYNWNFVMGFGTWNVRNFHRAGSLKTELRSFPKYIQLHSVGAQKVRWNKAGTEPSGSSTVFYRNGDENHHLVQAFLCT
jgi:hypothetical protein